MSVAINVGSAVGGAVVGFWLSTGAGVALTCVGALGGSELEGVESAGFFYSCYHCHCSILAVQQ